MAAATPRRGAPAGLISSGSGSAPVAADVTAARHAAPTTSTRRHRQKPASSAGRCREHSYMGAATSNDRSSFMHRPLAGPADCSADAAAAKREGELAAAATQAGSLGRRVGGVGVRGARLNVPNRAAQGTRAAMRGEDSRQEAVCAARGLSDWGSSRVGWAACSAGGFEACGRCNQATCPFSTCRRACGPQADQRQAPRGDGEREGKQPPRSATKRDQGPWLGADAQRRGRGRRTHSRGGGGSRECGGRKPLACCSSGSWASKRAGVQTGRSAAAHLCERLGGAVGPQASRSRGHVDDD